MRPEYDSPRCHPQNLGKNRCQAQSVMLRVQESSELRPGRTHNLGTAPLLYTATSLPLPRLAPPQPCDLQLPPQTHTGCPDTPNTGPISTWLLELDA